MRVGKGLLEVINRAQQLLEQQPVEQLELRPESVGPALQERRYRDTFHEGKSTLDTWLISKDFKKHYEAAVDGTSHRAAEARKVVKKFEAIFHRDSFEAFTRAPVTFKASDLQRVRIAG